MSSSSSRFRFVSLHAPNPLRDLTAKNSQKIFLDIIHISECVPVSGAQIRSDGDRGAYLGVRVLGANIDLSGLQIARGVLMPWKTKTLYQRFGLNFLYRRSVSDNRIGTRPVRNAF